MGEVRDAQAGHLIHGMPQLHVSTLWRFLTASQNQTVSTQSGPKLQAPCIRVYPEEEATRPFGRPRATLAQMETSGYGIIQKKRNAGCTKGLNKTSSSDPSYTFVSQACATVLLLVSFQFVNVCILPEIPKLGMVFHMRSHECQIEGKRINFVSAAG
ncbi:hypothetical protein BTVI_138418 [Pitangus sulphuratus]|nr:hypothetical protein BTVI_138418 [Pitangus sulphuratus]